MKGRISKSLESVLRDPAARAQLRNHLIGNRDGPITVGEKRYTVRLEIHKQGVKDPGGATVGKKS